MITLDHVIQHFSERAAKYDGSSKWCTDQALEEHVLGILHPTSEHHVLDVACGTGLVSKWFHKKVKRIVGVDITPKMFAQAADRLDEFHTGKGEDLPFADNSFDLVICRQGTQFMDDQQALHEMNRVCKPNGTVCVINLCAYSEDDKNEYFEILRLRNPVRKNFYLRQDMERLFKTAGLANVTIHEHLSAEDVDVWSDNGAISEERREAIRKVYREATPGFLKHHAVSTEDGSRFIDHMLFAIVTGTKTT